MRIRRNVLVLSGSGTKYASNIYPNSYKCQISNSYIEFSVSKSKSEQLL